MYQEFMDGVLHYISTCQNGTVDAGEALMWRWGRVLRIFWSAAKLKGLGMCGL